MDLLSLLLRVYFSFFIFTIHVEMHKYTQYKESWEASERTWKKNKREKKTYSSVHILIKK